MKFLDNVDCVKYSLEKKSQTMLVLYLKIFFQVDDVVGIMRENVEKVMERDSKLSDLDDR